MASVVYFQYWQIRPDAAQPVLLSSTQSFNASSTSKRNRQPLNDFQIESLKKQIQRLSNELIWHQDQLIINQIEIDQIISLLKPLEDRVAEISAFRENEAISSQHYALQLYQDLFNLHIDLDRSQHPDRYPDGSFIRILQDEVPNSESYVYLDLLSETGGKIAQLHNKLADMPFNKTLSYQQTIIFEQFLLTYQASQQLDGQLSHLQVICTDYHCEIRLRGKFNTGNYRHLDHLMDQFNNSGYWNIRLLNSVYEDRGLGIQSGVYVFGISD